MAYFLPHE
ncbi:hypothetical protein F383_33421 [Gossypium arboreum]|uniref:Uncharacterized protein n=1 Tax=Gossypium arboreum TaxID=29729 RepID=A0A0B0N0Z8_GOSAR|nr:hypothetical protein F383_33421 [Gossypium arboreum]